MAWHGFGLDGDIPREEALRVLDRIRARGPMSISDVARGYRISKEMRDQLLQRFAAEDLVKIDGKVVTATELSGICRGTLRPERIPSASQTLKSDCGQSNGVTAALR